MDRQALEALLDDHESDRVERKASPSDRDGIRQAVCAFANDLPNHRQPGVLFVGVNDDGSRSNLEIAEPVLRLLADILRDGNTLPIPTVKIGREHLHGHDVAVVLVSPAVAPPVRLRGQVWVRVGPTTRIASAEEERRLSEKRRAGDLPFDVRDVPSARLDDLDLRLFREVYLPSAIARESLDQNERSDSERLTSLRFLSSDGTPTVLAILVLGIDSRFFIAGNYIQLTRYDGTELTHPIKDQKEIDGPLPQMLRNLDEILLAQISSASRVEGGATESVNPDYPIEALRQIARNAVLHRNYEGTNAPIRISWFSDRIEIQNPGGPFGQVTSANFGRPGVTDYRNPHLAEAMKNLGYVQRFGLGIPLARKELNRNGNPELEFTVDTAYVLSTLRARR